MTTQSASSGSPGELKITQVSIDLKLGLFSFTYDDGITEQMMIRDETEVPTVAEFLKALTDEVTKFGRPQTRPREQAAPDGTR